MSLGKKLSVSLDNAKLKGTKFDVRHVESVHIFFALSDSPSQRRGLYRLTFDNGDTYVGQSVDVVHRFISHRKRWGDEIVFFEFFPVPSDDLDSLERQLIKLAEANGSVRNIKDTNQPGGQGDFDVSIADGPTIALPWDRSLRIKPGDPAVTKERNDFFTLTKRPYYQAMRDIAGWYVFNTIPDPFNTQEHLWVTTCLPSTCRSKSYQRLAVINTGMLETLVMSEEIERIDGEDHLYVDFFLNTTAGNFPPEKLNDDEHRWIVNEVTYKYGIVWQWTFDMESFIDILNGEIYFPHMNLLIDTAYELNVRLMRQNGSGLFRRHHNELLASDFLASSLNWVETDEPTN